MAVELQHFWIGVISVVHLIWICLAANKFDIILTDIKCGHNSQYALNSSCNLSEPAPASGASFNMMMKKDVKAYRMDLIFYLGRMKKYILLFKAPDLDVCEEFHKSQSIYLEMFKDMTQRAGKWPKCPISHDFYFKYTNITPRHEYLPAYLPPVTFKFEIAMKDKKVEFMYAHIFGRIVHKQGLKNKNKSRQ